MPVIAGPATGVHELKITQEAGRRFVVGLSWTPREMPKLEVEIAKTPEKGDTLGWVIYYLMEPFDFFRVLFLSTVKLGTMDRYAGLSVKKKDLEGRDTTAEQFDLDLDCYIYDKDMRLKCVIGTEGGNMLEIDGSKKIYHTGDDQSGMGGGDSEQVYVETRDLPEDYQHFFFVVRSDCKYSLDQFIKPGMRLADSKTDQNQLQASLTPPEDHIYKAFNYAFCHVFRDGDKWNFLNLDAFEGDNIEWEVYLPALSAQKAA